MRRSVSRPSRTASKADSSPSKKASSTVVLPERSAAPAGEIVDAVRSRGHRTVLCEGGPTVIGWLLRERLLDELFLTLSPRLAGREPGVARSGLVEGYALPPDGLVGAQLLSVKRGESHLFLRYRIASRVADSFP